MKLRGFLIHTHRCAKVAPPLGDRRRRRRRRCATRGGGGPRRRGRRFVLHHRRGRRLYVAAVVVVDDSAAASGGYASSAEEWRRRRHRSAARARRSSCRSCCASSTSCEATRCGSVYISYHSLLLCIYITTSDIMKSSRNLRTELLSRAGDRERPVLNLKCCAMAAHTMSTRQRAVNEASNYEARVINDSLGTGHRLYMCCDWQRDHFVRRARVT